MGQYEAQYNIFISYNSEDLVLVEPVVSFLREKGLRVFFFQLAYLTGTRLEEEFERSLLPCKAMVMFLGPQGLGKGQDMAKNLALARQAAEPSFRLVPVLLPGSAPSQEVISDDNGWVDLREEGDSSNGFAMLLQRLEGLAEFKETADLIQDPGKDLQPSLSEATSHGRANTIKRTEPRYDVFVSYSRADREAVKTLCNELVARGVAPFWDGLLPPGADWLTTLAEQIGACGACALCFGPNGSGNFQPIEMNAALREQHHLTIIPVLLPGGSIPEEDPLARLVKRFQASSLQDWLPRDFDQLADAILGARKPLKLGSPEPGAGQETLAERKKRKRPYKDLSWFREEDARFFFGREDLIDDLVKAVENTCITALVGFSGSGKSSVIHAGLIPALRKRKGWAAISMRPGPQPIHALATALVPLLESDLSIQLSIQEKAQRAGERADRILRGSERLELLVAEILKKRTREGVKRLLLVVDQWEELYTAPTESDEKERRQFVEQIVEATCQTGSPLSVLLACRADFFNGQVMHHAELGQRLQGKMIHILPMGHAKLLDVVLKPLVEEGSGFHFEPPELVDDIINDIEEGPGQLPLLELALTELWDKRDTQQRRLTRKAYQDLGGLQRALAQWADRVIEKFPEAQMRRLFLRLAYVRKDTPITRRRVHFDALDKPTQKIVNVLVKEHLLVFGRDAKTDALTVELAHEALLRNWGTLQLWLKADEEAQIKRRTRIKEGRIGLAAIAALIFVAIIYVNWLRNRTVESQALASETIQLRDRGLEAAMLLSLEAYQIRATAEARSNLLNLLQRSPHLKFFLSGDKQNKSSAIFDSTGRWIVSGGGRSACLWEVGDSVRLVSNFDKQERQSKPVISLAFGQGREVFMSKQDEGRIFRYSGSGEVEPSIEVPLGVRGIQNLTFYKNGARELLAYSIVEQVFVQDLARPLSKPLQLLAHADFVSKLAFSQDGRTLASAGLNNDRAVYLWKIPSNNNWKDPGAEERVKLPAEAEEGGFNGVAFNPMQGNILATSGKAIQLWDITGLWDAPAKAPELLGTLRDGSTKDSVMAVEFSQDGKILASAGADQRIRLWPFPLPQQWDRKPTAYLVGHGGTIWSLAFSSDGKLVSGGERGEVILWNMGLSPPLSRAVPIQLDSLKGIALNPEGTAMAVGESGGGISYYSLHDATAGASRKPLQHLHQSTVKRLAFAQGGHILASGDEDGRLFLWRDGTLLKEVSLPNLVPPQRDAILSLALTPDGKRGAVATKGKRIFVWKVEGNTPAVALFGAREAVSALAFDPRGEKLVSAGERQLILWDVSRKKLLFTQEDAHDEAISSIAFHPEGSLLASGSLDGMVILWQVGNVLTQQGGAIPVPPISALAWSHDGNMLAAGGANGTIALWDRKEGRLVGSGLQAGDRIAGLGFRENGELLSLSGAQLLQWDLRYESWRSYACSLLQGSLSQPEWMEWTRYLEGGSHHPLCPENLAKAIEPEHG